jgi:hypothetical protein
VKRAPASYGLLAEFETASQLVEAARRTRDAGYHAIDAFSPFPIEGLTDALGHRQRGRLPVLVLAGGLTGAAGGFLLQYYSMAIDYPLNVGGRPLFSWPAFIPITFELAVLVAAITTVLAMLGLNGLPMPYHPLFNVPGFARASRDRFFLCVESRDPQFDPHRTRAFLESLGAREVSDVEN